MKKNRYHHQRRIDDITDPQWAESFSGVADYLTRKLRGRTGHGPFSKAALGCKAVEFFSKRAYDKLVNGECYWPEDVDLTTQLCRIAKREIERMEQEWESGKKLTREEMKHEAEVDERANHSAKDLAYRIAITKIGNNPKLMTLLSCMYQETDRKEIARWMHIPLDEVMRLEAELISCLKP